MRKAISVLRTQDPVMGRLIEHVGPYRLRHLEASFETLTKSIVYQQLSGKVAATIFGRLKVAASDGRSLTPEAVLKLTTTKMRAVGLSRQKITYIRDLARLSRSGELDFQALHDMPDEEVIRSLTLVKGIGVWTAHMFLIFALRRLDVLPTGDLGIRAAIQKAYELPELPKAREMEAIAEKWRPYRTVASWYLWRSQEPDANL